MEYSSLDDIKEAIDEMQIKIADLTESIETFSTSGQSFCNTDNDDPSLDCPADCNDCALELVDIAERARDEEESNQDQLQAFVDVVAEYPDALVDQILEDKQGNLEHTLRWLNHNDFTVYESWDAYVDVYLESFDIPGPIEGYIDRDAVAADLASDSSYFEAGGLVVVVH